MIESKHLSHFWEVRNDFRRFDYCKFLTGNFVIFMCYIFYIYYFYFYSIYVLHIFFFCFVHKSSKFGSRRELKEIFCWKLVSFSSRNPMRLKKVEIKEVMCGQDQ